MLGYDLENEWIVNNEEQLFTVLFQRYIFLKSEPPDQTILAKHRLLVYLVVVE